MKRRVTRKGLSASSRNPAEAAAGAPAMTGNGTRRREFPLWGRRAFPQAAISFSAAATCFLLLAGRASAQTPVPFGTGASSKAQVDPGKFPDLIVEVTQTGKGVPTAYTVRNVGTAEAGPSILKIAVALLPLDPESKGRLTINPINLNELCKPPLQSLITKIDPIQPGNSKTFYPQGLFPALTSLAALTGVQRKQRPSQPEFSYLVPCELEAVCVFRAKVTADDAGWVKEGPKEENEKNNSVTVYVERKT